MKREQMDREVNPLIFFGLIAALVLIAGFFVWRSSDNPLNNPASGEAAYRQAEEMVRKQGQDPKAVLGREYYRYHPEELKNLHERVSGIPVTSPTGIQGVDPTKMGQGQGR